MPERAAGRYRPPVRRVLGKVVEDVNLAVLREQYGRVLLDVGTGDGKHVLTVAREQPGTLVVGLDAAPDRMRKAAARAAAKPARGGLPNAVFVWASAEKLPPDLRDVDELHVLMPWGSLLRGLLDDSPLRRDLAAAARPGAAFVVTLNLHAWRPRVPEVGDLPEPDASLAERFAADGWLVSAGDADVSSSWTRRLGSTRDELAVLTLAGILRPPG